MHLLFPNFTQNSNFSWPNNKHRIASIQITNAEIADIFKFLAVLVFKLLSHKVSFINRKDNRNCLEVGYFLRK